MSIRLSDILLQERENGVLYLTLNRPERRNALSNALMEELLEALRAFDREEGDRVAVIRGAGEHFCSGADIKQFGDAAAQTPEAIAHRAVVTMSVHSVVSQIAKPIITSVRGYALAGGCGVALAADFVIASETAIFGYPEVTRGFVPALVTTNLTKLVGRRRALELVLAGRRLSAREALQWGLINEVTKDASLEEATRGFAEKLAGFSPSAVANTKGLFYRVADMPLLEGLQASRAANEAMRKTKDFSAGVAAFQAKKP